MHRSRDAPFKNFRSGSHRSGTNLHGIKTSTEKKNTKTPPSANTCRDNAYLPSLPSLPLLVFFSLCGGKGLPIGAIRGRRWRLIQRQPKSLKFFYILSLPMVNIFFTLLLKFTAVFHHFDIVRYINRNSLIADFYKKNLLFHVLKSHNILFSNHNRSKWYFYLICKLISSKYLGSLCSFSSFRGGMAEI
jgi:hypothetical protein